MCFIGYFHLFISNSFNLRRKVKQRACNFNTKSISARSNNVKHTGIKKRFSSAAFIHKLGQKVKAKFSIAVYLKHHTCFWLRDAVGRFARVLAEIALVDALDYKVGCHVTAHRVLPHFFCGVAGGGALMRWTWRLSDKICCYKLFSFLFSVLIVVKGVFCTRHKVHPVL